jgi:hypothetical protein
LREVFETAFPLPDSEDPLVDLECVALVLEDFKASVGAVLTVEAFPMEAEAFPAVVEGEAPVVEAVAFPAVVEAAWGASPQHVSTS